MALAPGRGSIDIFAGLSGLGIGRPLLVGGADLLYRPHDQIGLYLSGQIRAAPQRQVEGLISTGIRIDL